MKWAPLLSHRLGCIVEKFAVIVEGQNDGQETAVTHGGLQVSDGVGCAERSTTSSENAYGAASSEGFYLNQNDEVRQLHTGLTAYFDFYNHEKPHQSLNYRTPAKEHFVLCSEPAAFA